MIPKPDFGVINSVTYFDLLVSLTVYYNELLLITVIVNTIINMINYYLQCTSKTGHAN